MPSPNNCTDGNTDIEVTVGLLDEVEQLGRLPFESEMDDMPPEFSDTVRAIRENADQTDVSPEELLLELKRLLSVSQGIPDATDIDDWSDDESAATYESVFGSVENAIELALVSNAGELRVIVNGQYRDEI